MSKTNTKLYEIEYYLEYTFIKVNFEQFPTSNIQRVLFCKFTIQQKSWGKNRK